MSGFIALHREAREHPLFAGDVARFGAWFWLVSSACWKPTKFNVNGTIITLQRGQLCVSVRQLAEEWGWSKSTVDRFLTRLKTETMIGTDSGTGRLVVTICNYEKYQSQDQQGGTRKGTGSGTAAGQQRDTKEQRNKEPNGSMDNPPTPHRDADWPEIPEWIPVAAWNGWLDMRRGKGDWPTARAIEIAIGKLTEWRSKGHDPGSILDKSTLSRWTGLFEPKDNRNDRDRQTSWSPPAGDRRSGPAPDGFSAAINDALDRSGSGHASGEAGRHDAGLDRNPRQLNPPGRTDL